VSDALLIEGLWAVSEAAAAAGDDEEHDLENGDVLLEQVDPQVCVRARVAPAVCVCGGVGGCVLGLLTRCVRAPSRSTTQQTRQPRNPSSRDSRTHTRAHAHTQTQGAAAAAALEAADDVADYIGLAEPDALRAEVLAKRSAAAPAGLGGASMLGPGVTGISLPNRALVSVGG
jgi:hypothetical protein